MNPPTYITVVANSGDYDALADNQPRQKDRGDFYLKTNKHFNSTNLTAVTCNHVTIENGILNYDSQLHYIEGHSNFLKGQHHFNNISSFLSAIFGERGNIISYDPEHDKMVIILGTNEQVRMSKELSEIFGFETTHFIGPLVEYSKQAPDVYRKFRTLYLCADFCEITYAGVDRHEPILCTIDANQIGSTISTHFTSNNWRRMVSPVGIYTHLKLLDSSFQKVPFLKNSKLSIQFTFRSGLFYDL